MAGTPSAEVDVTVGLVRRLLRAQHPDLADLPLRVVANGWDNVTLRLGDDLAVRVPRRATAGQLVRNEQRWLPVLAPRLGVDAPVPVRIGVPADELPWSWSVVPWFTGAMVVTELALAVVLLAGAGLMIRSFFNLERLNLGFSPEHLITMRLQLPDQRYDTPEARVAFYDRLLPKLAAVPGVESVAVSTTMPPFRAFGRGFEIEGRPAPGGEEEQLRAPVNEEGLSEAHAVDVGA